MGETKAVKRPRGRPTTGKAKTPAQRKAAERARRAAEWPQWLQAVYHAGYEDGAAGKAPAACETWADQNAALAYICGGFDGSKP